MKKSKLDFIRVSDRQTQMLWKIAVEGKDILEAEKIRRATTKFVRSFKNA